MDGVPILTVRGKPAEMGEQFGKLAIANAPDLNGLHERFLKDSKQEKNYPAIVFAATKLKSRFPAHILPRWRPRRKPPDRELSLLLFANTVADLSSGMGCSTVVVEPERSTTGKSALRPQLRLASHEGHHRSHAHRGLQGRGEACVRRSHDLSDFGRHQRHERRGIIASRSTRSAFGRARTSRSSTGRARRCCSHSAACWKSARTVAEAEKLLRDMPRTTTCCLTLCDKNGGAVFEITPTNLEVRSARKRRLLLHEPLPHREALRGRQVLALRRSSPRC